MKILVVAPEVAGLAPVGGLAEFVFGLATALLRRGHDVKVAIPSYGFLRSRSDLHATTDRLKVRLGVATEASPVFEGYLDCPGTDGIRLPVIVLGEHRHFRLVESSDDIYQWPDHEPWIAFSRSVIDFLDSCSWRPDVIHCHDSYAALIPVYVEQLRQQEPSHPLGSARTVLTIHHLRNQGIGDPALVGYAGLPQEWFHIEGFEYYGSANCFKAGILSADRVSTVGPTYAAEMCASSDFGFGLEGLMQRLRHEGKLTAILNGIDLDRWRVPDASYNGDNSIDTILRAKQHLRQLLYPKWEWDAGAEPVIAVRSRWDDDKGIALIGGCIERILRKARVVMRVWGTSGGSGELRHLWPRLQDLASQKRSRFLLDPPGDDSVLDVAAHYTVADFLLMPSRYEPCGLAQLECQRYGTIPIVRQTGGLADTVSENGSGSFPSPNGFLFKEFTSEGLEHAVERAVEAFYDTRVRRERIWNAVHQRNGWDRRVEEYEVLLGG